MATIEPHLALPSMIVPNITSLTYFGDGCFTTELGLRPVIDSPPESLSFYTPIIYIDDGATPLTDALIRTCALRAKLVFGEGWQFAIDRATSEASLRLDEGSGDVTLSVSFSDAPKV